MKKELLFLSILAVAGMTTANAQVERKIKIYKDNAVIFENAVSEIDSVVFSKAKAEVSLPIIEMIDVPATEGSVFTVHPVQTGEDAVKELTVAIDGFKIGKYEVTQALWRAVMGNNPSNFQSFEENESEDNMPVEMVSWEDVQQFITTLNELTGLQYDLPTETEWEYAARGGKDNPDYSQIAFSGSTGANVIGDYGWISTNASQKTHPIGTKKPNYLGIYDMTGNVAEWCSDHFGGTFPSGVDNPTGPDTPNTGNTHLARGGAYLNSATTSKITLRGGRSGVDKSRGFRLVIRNK